jgi:predicted type IV restriction endonuclease
MNTPTNTQPISDLSLQDLQEKFGLSRERTDSFFLQWLSQTKLLSDYEQQALSRLKCNYENIIETNPLEEVVKLVVVAPLLDLAGFYQPPFSIRAEVSTKLIVTDDNQTYIGKIDVLVVKQKLWVLVIESKQSRFDVTSGIPQALSYMLSQPANTQSNQDKNNTNRFGMVTNGREVVFLKLKSDEPPVYIQSKIYQVIDGEDDLVSILQGLKFIGKNYL